MSDLTNKQIKQIFDGAPDGAGGINLDHANKWKSDNENHHNLSDLREILALRERVAELEQGGWISVDERLPDTDGVYLTYNPRSYFYLPEQVMRFIKGGWEFSNALITHWSNLPQLPKEQDND